ncbi:nucleoside-binding protein [Brockia lithotrophica]|uniref:Nucleoside-binding protein n=2 Tax=Brockia lithotrophica TaxID=933949 RepID=A0A660L2Z2_9BACL|nr:BMP family ABC transporter substrate-binding protein [Brockia lithotrophica]RKQ88371.1 nucleoside-binding protein [Brockia lithotrophica]
MIGVHRTGDGNGRVENPNGGGDMKGHPKFRRVPTFRRVGAIALAFVLALGLLAGCAKGSAPAPGAGEHKDFRVGMVTDIGGVNDNSFNQGAWEGLQRFGKETGATVKYVESKSDADYVPNLQQFAQGGYSLIWGIGYMMADAVRDVASKNPAIKFGIIDGEVKGLDNVTSVTFAEQEGAFLVGVVAGLMTKTGKVGFVGGMDIPVIKRFEAGFKAGVRAANPNAQVLVAYTGNFNRPDDGKSAAASLYDKGADIVFHAAGQTGDGVFSEAKDRRKAGQEVWVIGVDRDQRDLGPEVTLTSMLKRVDVAIYDVSKSVMEGKFTPGIVTLGLKEDAVGLPKDNPHVPQDVMQKVQEFKEKIVKGEIVVPTTPEY